MSGRPIATRPIGIFDSGVGGLTVLKALRDQLPQESIVYFGDTARVPYGPKSPATVRRYAREAAAFLLSREVKVVVVACNTATAHACEYLAAELPVPVLGVVQPGVRAAVGATRTGRIGVIGTAGTIGSGAYDLAVRRAVAEARVYAQPCPLFVPLVEEGLAMHSATRIIAEEYLRPLLDVDIDTLILGCTHYPLLQPVLGDVLGGAVSMVDSGAETAEETRTLLADRGWLRQEVAPPDITFVVSDSPVRFREIGRRFLGEVLRHVERVDVEGYDRAA